MHQEAIPYHGSDHQPAPEFSPQARAFAQVVSYITHPLFIPTLVTFLVLQSLPEYFVAFKMSSKRFAFDMLYFRVIIISLFFPLLTVMLAKMLGFISSIYLNTQRDRIIPYVAIIIYYFWAFYTFLEEGAAPKFYTAFFLGMFLAISISFVTNSFWKTSMHATGWGGVIGFLLSLMWGMQMNVSLPLIITFFVAGIVGTCRMMLKAHTPAEIYIGFSIGILTQLASCWMLVI
ncbi:hypothetical protein SAMN05444266_107485 [Chitinophaga jiangningensis]|uniref:PAP2 superfamily protein n=1 Tax=Chitinophaga jiangningensis TaxID=1419482 RepID=A0A1M7I2P2_9BACT|nr:hypothetical protein [Chitinophaga jiangningensis]SHM35056.1 hypothetical protein SAMN05444266_107485 [Chitinophaga jiangningensis]